MQLNSIRRRTLVFARLAILAVTVRQQPARTALNPSLPASQAHPIRLASGKHFSLRLPQGFDISVAAEGLGRARFLTKAPDGRIFVTDLHDLSDNSLGAVYILDGFNSSTGRFSRVIPYLKHQRNPNSVAFATDSSGQLWLYVALTDRLERFRFRAGETSPAGVPEVIATYPDYGLNYKYGGWHLTRTLAVVERAGEKKIYVAVGSSCNECEEKEEIRATISRMDLDGKHARIIARGLRNAVGLRYQSPALYATNMGADHLGDDAPDDTMFRLEGEQLDGGKIGNYGWPYCYFEDGGVLADPTFAASARKLDCSLVPSAFATFAAHSSPLGLDYFDSSAPPPLGGYFLVALHGASKQKLERGYRVVRVRADSGAEDFVTGFLENGVVYGRPCDILRVGKDGFFMTDDYNGVVYYVRPHL
jgi:glucose/arabinose dehydrogenase